MGYSLLLDDGQELKPKEVIESVVFLNSNYFVVNDKKYEQLGFPTRVDTIAVWKAKKGQEDQLLEAGKKVTEQLEHKAFSVDYSIYQINKAFGPILFIGLFIGMVFFVSAGSFLYFRLFTDIEEEKRKFRSIAKIGLTPTELNKVVNRQIAILFFSPIVVALVHGSIALTALSHMFNYNLTLESTFVLGSFTFIQLIYYLIARIIYVKQVG